MKLNLFFDKVIAYSFYLIFFLVPLVLTNDTSELFELNKIWVTWGLTVIICAAWISKMIIDKQIKIQKTVFDIPLLLFLLSQIISTLISLDSRISFWGYYSRFNGGLLSTITYIFLYYALVSNLSIKHVYKIITTSMIAGFIVAIWGLPSHFGKDPTCLLFRGTFDVSCWTDAFQPKLRIFSTIGQPAWLSAYMAVLLPISIVLVLKNLFPKEGKRRLYLGILYVLITIIFYLDLIFTDTRAGFIAFWAGNLAFWGFVLLRSKSKQFILKLGAGFISGLLLINFFFGIPVSQLAPFILANIMHKAPTQSSQNEPIKPEVKQQPQTASGELGGTDSSTIRLIVWQGAINAWKANPVFGTGVETFAFGYYANRPAAHNLTSEWDYLYNKAHNEYLNYLSTTGIFGLGTYMLFVTLFFVVLVLILLDRKVPSILKKLIKLPESETINYNQYLYITALGAGFLTILISNFFGFSVVIINLYLFLIPAFILLLSSRIDTNNLLSIPKQAAKNPSPALSIGQIISLSIIFLFAIFLNYKLYSFWDADKAYALGSNLDRVGEYEQALPYLQKAVEKRATEPVFSDELAINNALLASAYYQQKNDATSAAQLIENATKLSNEVVINHPNNIAFWKNRVRLFYSLSQLDNRYFGTALEAIKKVTELAPTDAKSRYNAGVLYGQAGQYDLAISELQKTLELRPGYRDAYFALGLFYHEKAKDPNGRVTNSEMQQKALDSMNVILTSTPNDEAVLTTLKEWESGK